MRLYIRFHFRDQAIQNAERVSKLLAVVAIDIISAINLDFVNGQKLKQRLRILHDFAVRLHAQRRHLQICQVFAQQLVALRRPDIGVLSPAHPKLKRSHALRQFGV